MLIVGLDVGSTTVKASVMENGAVRWQDYMRHNTKQAEMVLEFLDRMESECGLSPGRDRVFMTGSGAGLLAPLIGARMVQEVVAVSAAVERLHPDVNFVSEIGGEDMKTLFFTPSGEGKSKQVYMQSACSGGTGTFIEKTARKLQISPERLAQAGYDGYNVHRISSKCGIFAETDSNTLVKSGVPVEEIVASLYEAVVYQNLSTLTKGNTPMPGVLLLGGPNLFFRGLQEAWRHHLGDLWKERGIDADPTTAIKVPKEAVYYACLGCIEIAADEPAVGVFTGREKLAWWIEEGQWEAKAKEGAKGLAKDQSELDSFLARYSAQSKRDLRKSSSSAVLFGCDFGSTTAKAVVLSSERETALQLLRAVRGQSDRGCKIVIPPTAAGRLRGCRRTRHNRLRQRPAQGCDRRRSRDRRDGCARHRGTALLPGRGCDLRRRRLRREDHDPASGHSRGFSLELTVLIGQRRFFAGCRRALFGAARAIRRACVQGEGSAGARHGLRRVSSIRYRQPAAQGLVGRRDHGGACRRSTAQRVGLCRATAKPRCRRTQVHPAGRHAPQPRSSQSAGRLHPGEGAETPRSWCIRTPERRARSAPPCAPAT